MSFPAEIFMTQTQLELEKDTAKKIIRYICCNEIDIGTILKLKYQGFTYYYVVLGMLSKKNELLCLNIEDKLEHIDILYDYVNYTNLLSSLRVRYLDLYNLEENNYSIVSKLNKYRLKKCMENVKILKTFIDTFYRTIQYSTLMINFRVGTIFKQYFYEYLVIQINPKILLVQLDLDRIKTEKEYKDYLIKHNKDLKIIELEDIERYKYGIEYIKTINQVDVLKLRNKLSMIGVLH